MKHALVRLVSPEQTPFDRSTKADLWRDIVAVRIATMVALAAAVATIDLVHSAVVWVALLVAALQVPVLLWTLRRVHALRPIFPLVDAVVLGAVVLLEPGLLPLIGCLIIATAAYSASTFGRSIGVLVAVVGASMLAASAVAHRPADWLPTLLVFVAGLQTAVVICSKAASVANAMRQAVGDVLESVDTVVWESSGDTLDATSIYGPIERMLGWPLEKHLEPGSWEELVHLDDRHVVDHAKQATAAGTGHTIRYRIQTLSGDYRWIEDTVSVAKNDRGEVTHTRGLCRDVSDAVAASQFAERYVQFIESLPLGVLILELVDPTDATSFVVRAANPAIEPFSPTPMTDTIGQRLIDARPDVFQSHNGDGIGLVEIVADAVRRQQPAFIEALDVIRRDGVELHVSMWITPLAGNYVAVLSEDVSEIVKARRMLESLAYRDPLTALPNRTALHNELDKMLAASDAEGYGVTLAVLDLDQFKEVNDAFGHRLGDELLIAVTNALRCCSPAGAIVARLGGDEFAVLARLDVEDAARLGDQLRSAFERPLRLDSGLTLQASASIGLATYPEQADSAATLLQHADVAMYMAKRQNIGAAVYAPELDRSSARRVTLLGDLRRAIDDGELTLHYQPIIDIDTGMVRRVEGLIRWEHPELGLLHPAEFIELTELNNLNRGVVHTVVRQGLETLGRWRRNGAEVGLSVNIGGRTLADTELIGEIVDIVSEARLPRHSFGIELTERHLLLDTEATLRSLERLAAADIWLSIDDFGTGSSSLWALRQIPAHELKIDRSFVEDLRRGQSGIIGSIVAMAHDLGLEVVAEGVEDEVTYQWLRDSGCDHVQGYLVAPPMPAWQVELMFHLPCRPGRLRRTIAP
ncbi:MAG: EAL domain-containing protein [Acidimicrobiia bacterium]